MNFPIIFTIFLLSLTTHIGEAEELACDKGLFLSDRSTKINVRKSETPNKRLCILCYKGMQRTWLLMFVNPRMTIQGSNNIAPEDMAIYYGRNVSDVKSQSETIMAQALNSLLLLKTEHSFSPFIQSCIGLHSAESYTVQFRVRNPELWYLAYIAIGVVVFFLAPVWSRNVALHYATGMTVGILSSVLIIMFILTRLMPQRLKSFGYVVMAVSSSASLFMFQVVKTYMLDIIQDYWQYALGYILVMALLSFGLIYRFGPVSDSRTLNLICWIMQGIGLFFIYQGTQIPEASTAIILLVVTVYLCPKAMPSWIDRLRYRFFPPQRRLLTEEEWQREGEEETRKALEELRQYCRSPQCDTWSVISRLRSPTATRLAEFMNGSQHFSDAEIDEHERFVQYGRPFNLLNAPDDGSDDDNDSDRDASSSRAAPTSQRHNVSLRTNGANINNINNNSEEESEIEDTAYYRVGRPR